MKENNKNNYPDLETISKNNNNNFSFEILGEDEHEKLRILSGKNINQNLSSFDPSEDIVSESKSNINLFGSDKNNKKIISEK